MMKQFLILLLLSALFVRCSGPSEDRNASDTEQVNDENRESLNGAENPLRDAAVSAISDAEDRAYGLADSGVESPIDRATVPLCADFLAEYTAWSDRFIEAATGLIEHPGDPAYQDRYRKVASKVQEWNSRWEELQDCPDHPDFRAKFEALGRKMEQEIAKLQAE